MWPAVARFSVYPLQKNLYTSSLLLHNHSSVHETSKVMTTDANMQHPPPPPPGVLDLEQTEFEILWDFRLPVEWWKWKWKFKTDSKGLSSCPQRKPQSGGWQMGCLSGCYRTRKMTLQIYLLVSSGSAGLFAYRGVCKTKRDFHLVIDVRQVNGLQPLEIKKVETLTTALRLSETTNFWPLLWKTRNTFSVFLTSSMKTKPGNLWFMITNSHFRLLPIIILMHKASSSRAM